MGRKAKYKPTEGKTSTAQIEAIKAYRERNKGKFKSVSVTLEARQMEADKKRIAAAGYSITQFWRVSVDALPPLEDNAAAGADAPSEGNAESDSTDPDEPPTT